MWASAPGATEAGSGEGWSGLPWPCQAPSPPAPRADSAPVCARPGLGVHPPAFSSAASSPCNPSSRTGLCHRARGVVTVSSGSGAGQRAVGLSGGLGFSSWGPRDGGKSWWCLWASVPHRRLGSAHRLPACSPGPWGQRGASEGAWLWTTVPSGDGDGARRAASSTQLPPPLARTPGQASSKAEASSRGRGLAALTNGPGAAPVEPRLPGLHLETLTFTVLSTLWPRSSIMRMFEHVAKLKTLYEEPPPAAAWTDQPLPRPAGRRNTELRVAT